MLCKQILLCTAQNALAAAGRDPDPVLVEDVHFLASRMDDMLRTCLGSSEASGGSCGSILSQVVWMLWIFEPRGGYGRGGFGAERLQVGVIWIFTASTLLTKYLVPW